MRGFLFLLVFSGFVSQVQATVIRVGVGDQNRDALNLVDGKLVGKMKNFYQCPFDKSGFKFEMSLYPQARILLQLQRGEIDIGLPLVRLEPRDAYAVFTRPMADIPFVLYARENIDPASDLSSYAFAVMRASASGELVAERQAKFVEVSSWVQALELARLGRFDGAVIPAVIVESLAAENFAGLRRIEFGSIPLSLYVSKAIDNTGFLVTRLNSAIAACQGQ